MPADGLTKGLTKQKNDRFIEQLNLVDILTRLGPISAKDSKVATGSSGTATAEPAVPAGVCQTSREAKAPVAAPIDAR
jgi:hypothetical protein